jgi:hypothetical protein
MEDLSSMLIALLRNKNMESPRMRNVQGGRPIDLSRPVIKNPDGSISTERTATFETDGAHYVLPTIVGGKQLDPRAAYDAWLAGQNPEVGNFPTREEADNYARQRTIEIGKLRGVGR